MSAREAIEAAVGRALEILAGAPANARVAALVDQLGAIARRLAASDDVGLVRDDLVVAAHAASFAVVEESAPRAIAAPLARAIDELFGASAPPAFLGEPMPPPDAPLRATHGRPLVRAVRRAPFVRARPSASPEPHTVDVAPEPAELDEPDDALLDEPTDPTDAEAASEGVFDPTASAPPPIRRSPERGAPVAIDAFYGRIVDECIEVIAGLARDRERGPFFARADLELRLARRLDAIAAVGADLVERALGFWKRSLELPSPSSTFASALVLATLRGGDALDAIACGAELLDPSWVTHAFAIADALDAVEHPDVEAFARHLSRAAHPIARAAGVDLLGRRARLAPDEIARKLGDPSVAPSAAAARAAAHLTREDAAPIAPFVARWFRHPDQAVAWPAARASALWGRDDALAALRAREESALRLGVRALDLLVLQGEARDRDLFFSIASRHPRTPDLLAAHARFGDARAAGILVAALGDEDVADDAADALELLLGLRVPDLQRLDAGAWRKALRDAALDPIVRVREGAPWSPATVASFLEGERPKAADVRADLDELAVRCGVRSPVDLAQFTPRPQTELGVAVAETRRAAARSRPGSWSRA